MSQQYKNKPVVLITGAGSGLGAAMARRYALAGFSVVVSDIDEERARQVSNEIIQSGASAMSLVLDTTCQEHWEQARAHIKSEWGGVNVVINNAGVAAAGTCEETSMEDWQWVLDIDLMGVVRGCHCFLPELLEKAGTGQSAYIINIASFAGFSAMPGITAYGTAKAAVIALSEHLLTELDGSGVGVSVVCPSFVPTNLLETFRSNNEDTRKTVERWMKHSEIDADGVADMVFKAMEQQRFLVLTHSKTHWALRLKRFWPSRYYQKISKMGRLARGDKA